MTQYVLEITKWLEFSLITDFIKRVSDNISHAREVRKTYNELNSLTNRELNDIGISRGEIRSIAEGIF